MRAARFLPVAILGVLASQGLSLHAAEPGWRHLSSKQGDLPVPGKSTQQTACLVADLDRSGRNGFVLGFRATGPALVWYRPTAKGWDCQVIEPDFLTIEAGGTSADIDGDGWPDLVFGGDSQSNCVWWWRNPGNDRHSAMRWERHTVKKSGKTQHHDQCFADYKGTGKPQLAFWNQGASTLFVAEIPSQPRQVDEWPTERVFTGNAGEGPGKYAEGMSSFDIDADGRPEILAGNHMFTYDRSGKWRATRIGDIGGLIFAGRLFKDSRIPQVVIAPGDGSGPVKWYECQGDPFETKNWQGHDLAGRTLIHPHSLQVADIDGDGNLDIFVAEMAKWTESRKDPDNPKAQAFICYGDGSGHFHKTIFQTGMGFHETRVADLNGDGKLDILSKPYNWETPRLDIWLNQGPARSTASGDTSWMRQAKYGIFVHYQYRILLGYSIATTPQFPTPAQMTAGEWNRFVDGFDVHGFADQVAEARVGWVIFCIDDHYFAWPCAPNQAFDKYTGYAPGEKCARRDLIMDLADALNARGVKLICYYAGLNGYTREPKIFAGLGDDGNSKTAPSAESRKRRLEVLKGYADRYQDKITGWWFDGMELNSFKDKPDDWATIDSIVHRANPRAVIAFSYGDNEQACVQQGIDDYTGGDTWSKQQLSRFTPKNAPAQGGILWHGKIYCGNVYHGQGDANQFSDQELIDWINTCNIQGGVCTLDWPLDPRTGLIKDFGFAQLKRIARAVKGDESATQRPADQPKSE